MKRELQAQPLAFPTPVYVVGTYNEDGMPNAMTAAWGGVASTTPPGLYIDLSLGHKTTENIRRTGCFTVAIPDPSLMEVADYLGIVSGHKVDKFADAGLTQTKSTKVDAPVIDQFKLTMECEVRHIMEETGAMIVGNIVGIVADESILNEDGKVDFTLLRPLAFDPACGRYSVMENVAGKAFSCGMALKKK